MSNNSKEGKTRKEIRDSGVVTRVFKNAIRAYQSSLRSSGNWSRTDKEFIKKVKKEYLYYV